MGAHKPLSLPASALGPFAPWLEERKVQHLSSVISFPSVTAIQGPMDQGCRVTPGPRVS